MTSRLHRWGSSRGPFLRQLRCCCCSFPLPCEAPGGDGAAPAEFLPRDMKSMAFCWSLTLVGGWPTPLKKYEGQLGGWNSQYMENKKCSKPPTSVSYATGSFWDHLIHGDTLMRKNRFETWLGSRGAAMVIPPVQPFRKDLISVANDDTTHSILQGQHDTAIHSETLLMWSALLPLTYPTFEGHLEFSHKRRSVSKPISCAKLCGMSGWTLMSMNFLVYGTWMGWSPSSDRVIFCSQWMLSRGISASLCSFKLRPSNLDPSGSGWNCVA